MCDCTELKSSIDALLEATQQLKSNLRASIPSDVDEYFSVTNSTTLNVRPQTRNQIRVTAVIFECSSTAVLTIGNRTFNGLSAGLYTWFGLHWILNADDIRQLNQTVAGNMTLELMGESLADTGVW